MSDPQKDTGYLLPDAIEGWDLICVTLKIPDTPEYRSAFRGALKSLTEWHKWERTGDTKGSQAATYWRQIINEHLIIMDCDELDLVGDGDDMAQFRMCWFQSEDGPILRYTLNGCTWHDVLNCDGSVPGTDGGEPVNPPVDPIDEPGDFPPPDLVAGDRCRVINGAFFNVFENAEYFFTGVINTAPSNRAYALQQRLDSWDEVGNGLQWYNPFSMLMQNYIPHIAAIENAWESALWDEFISCVVDGCYPILTDIDRNIMNCIADGIDDVADGLNEVTQADVITTLKYIADFFRIFPLSFVRAQAFRSSVNPAVSDACPDCGGGGGGGGCANVFVTFETGTSFPYSLMIGAEAIGKNGVGIKSIDLPPGTFSSDPSFVKDNAVKVVIPLPEPCLVKGIHWQTKIKIGNPTPNANVYITPGIIIRTTSLGALTSVQEPKPKKYYFYWSTDWTRAGYTYPSAVWADTIEITMYFGTKYPARLIETVIDEVEITMMD